MIRQHAPLGPVLLTLPAQDVNPRGVMETLGETIARWSER